MVVAAATAVVVTTVAAVRQVVAVIATPRTAIRRMAAVAILTVLPVAVADIPTAPPVEAVDMAGVVAFVRIGQPSVLVSQQGAQPGQVVATMRVPAEARDIQPITTATLTAHQGAMVLPDTRPAVDPAGTLFNECTTVVREQVTAVVAEAQALSTAAVALATEAQDMEVLAFTTAHPRACLQQLALSYRA